MREPVMLNRHMKIVVNGKIYSQHDTVNLSKSTDAAGGASRLTLAKLILDCFSVIDVKKKQ